MFKLIIQFFFILFLSISLVSITSIFTIGVDVVSTAQTADGQAAPIGPLDKPVDQSNIIIPGCSLSILESKIGVSVSQKDKFLSGCIQGVLRFIIVISVLAAVLKIAASGLVSMTPMKMGSVENPASVVSNLIVGLFLLLVGWNLVPTLNASFNNQNYLNLPTFTVCPIREGNTCLTYNEKKTNIAKEAIQKYTLAKQTKQWITSKFDNTYTINVLDSICRARADDVSYLNIDRAFCKEDYRKFLESIAPKDEVATANVDDSLLVKVPNYDSNTSNAKERGGIKTNIPPLITLHHTAGARDNIDGNRNAIETGVGTAPSVQFGIKDDPNKVDYFMEMTSKGAHAVGTWFSADYSSSMVNSQSFGVEIYYNPDTGEIPTDNQITATAKLMALLEKKYKSGPDQITFHGEIDPEYRRNEPWGLAFESPAYNARTDIKIHPNWIKFVSKVRSFGAWKAGSFSDMDDNKLGKYIFRRNIENGLTSSPNGSKAGEYKKWLDNNK